MTDQPSQHDTQPFEPVTPEPAQTEPAGQPLDAPPAPASSPVRLAPPRRMGGIS